ncbi:MAG: transporter [Deltaproteobacteria bacterium]|nr:transporter [Deltaproteobacteria bacterium]
MQKTNQAWSYLLGKYKYVLLLFLIFISFSLKQVRAQQQPFINLGLTSFLDGAPPSGPGLYLSNYNLYYHSDTFRDNNGNRVPFPDVNIFAQAFQLIYMAPHELPTRAKWGLNLLLPVVYLNNNGPEGIGDLFFGPFIQWDPIMGKNGPIFMHRVELSGVFPVGKYDESALVSPGSNIFYFNPYWAGTVLPKPWWSISWRIHYLYNSANNDPNPLFFPGVEKAQAGQAFHLNFTTSFEVMPKRFRLGINGYYLKQLNDVKFDGVSIPNTKEQIFGIGPGALVHFGRDDHLFINTYFEALARNRPERILVNVRYVHNFPIGRKDMMPPP